MSNHNKEMVFGLSCQMVCWLVSLAFGLFLGAVLHVWLNTGMILAIIGALISVAAAGYLLNRWFCSGIIEASTKISAGKAVAQDPISPAPASNATEVDASGRKIQKPETLGSARGHQADDLKLIKGVGPGLQTVLNDMGFFHFDQIADWKPRHVNWVDDNLVKFKGRASRDGWVKQAKVLAAGGPTVFSEKAAKDAAEE